jgi:hypothetical protein
LLTSVDDLLSELNYLDGLRPAPISEKPGTPEGTPANLTMDEARVFACFAGGAQLTPAALAELKGLAAAPLSALVAAPCETAAAARQTWAIDAASGELSLPLSARMRERLLHRRASACLRCVCVCVCVPGGVVPPPEKQVIYTQLCPAL